MLREEIYSQGKKAADASKILASMLSSEKNSILLKMASSIRANEKEILEANRADLEDGRKNGLSEPLLERLTLNKERIEGMASGLEKIATLDDPVWQHLGSCKNQNGLEIQKVRVPLGVIGIIYESRPNVTADAAGLCLKSGNAVILKGGKEAINSNRAIASVMSRIASSSGLPEGTVQLIDDTSRESTSILMRMNDYLDVLIPRGGKGLKKAIQENASVPVIMTGMGVCHVFIDSSAEPVMARRVAVNAKISRPSTCNSAETFIVHSDIAGSILPDLVKDLVAEGVEVRGDEEVIKIVPSVIPAKEEDWATEYLDMIVSVKIVDSVEEAVKHINKYGTGHSESILTDSYESSQYFLRNVDAAAVYVNVSTRFTDGGEFGFGAEMGISTQKLHARGPMGLEQLTSVKYIVRGNGQIR